MEGANDRSNDRDGERSEVDDLSRQFINLNVFDEERNRADRILFAKNLQTQYDNIRMEVQFLDDNIEPMAGLVLSNIMLRKVVDFECGVQPFSREKQKLMPVFHLIVSCRFSKNVKKSFKEFSIEQVRNLINLFEDSGVKEIGQLGGILTWAEGNWRSEPEFHAHLRICERELLRARSRADCSPFLFAMAHVCDYTFSEVKCHISLRQPCSPMIDKDDNANAVYLRRRLNLDGTQTDIYALVRKWDGASLGFTHYENKGCLIWYPVCHNQYVTYQDNEVYPPHGWFKLYETAAETGPFRLFSYPDFRKKIQKYKYLWWLQSRDRWQKTPKNVPKRIAFFLKVDINTQRISAAGEEREGSLFIETNSGLRLYRSDSIIYDIQLPQMKPYIRKSPTNIEAENKYFKEDYGMLDSTAQDSWEGIITQLRVLRPYMVLHPFLPIIGFKGNSSVSERDRFSSGVEHIFSRIQEFVGIVSTSNKFGCEIVLIIDRIRSLMRSDVIREPEPIVRNTSITTTDRKESPQDNIDIDVTLRDELSNLSTVDRDSTLSETATSIPGYHTRFIDGKNTPSLDANWGSPELVAYSWMAPHIFYNSVLLSCDVDRATWRENYRFFGKYYEVVS